MLTVSFSPFSKQAIYEVSDHETSTQSTLHLDAQRCNHVWNLVQKLLRTVKLASDEVAISPPVP